MPSSLEQTPTVLTRIADAIVDALNDGEFCQEFTAERKTDLVKSMDEVKGLCVFIYGLRTARKQDTRSTQRRDHQIGIAVLRRPGKSETLDDLADGMQLLAEQIADHIDDNPIELCGVNLRSDDIVIDSPYSGEVLRNQRICICPITVPFIEFVK